MVLRFYKETVFTFHAYSLEELLILRKRFIREFSLLLFNKYNVPLNRPRDNVKVKLSLVSAWSSSERGLGWNGEAGRCTRKIGEVQCSEPQGSVAGPARDPHELPGGGDAGLKQSRSRMHKVWRLACGDAEKRASNKNITLCPDKLVDCHSTSQWPEIFLKCF